MLIQLIGCLLIFVGGGLFVYGALWHSAVSKGRTAQLRMFHQNVSQIPTGKPDNAETYDKTGKIVQELNGKILKDV